jgi:acylphosphatase
MNACIRCRISGRVQGVCFRAATRERALRLGLTGWVRNLSDGRVEVVACGPKEHLAKLRAWLWQGPELAEVAAVQCEPMEIAPFTDFRVR